MDKSISELEKEIDEINNLIAKSLFNRERLQKKLNSLKRKLEGKSN